ncbi:MAG: HD domain-containing protein [Bryobacterales bacterium]|nr:HD domain-containing protein [Bryobacterales bacterium]
MDRTIPLMKTFVKDLQPNQIARSNFLVQNKDVRQKKSGEPFLSLTIGDKSGDIDAKMWDNVADVVDLFGVGDFVRVKGVMSLYNGRPQFTIHSLERIDERDVHLPDFFAASARDPEEMFAELKGIVDAMQDPHLKALLLAFFNDPSIRERYKKAPAAKQIHHAFLGGLIEHVLSLCTLAKTVGPHYPVVNLDLLLTGIILHDIGKIEELTYERSLGYSDVGQLLGHIAIGVRFLHDKLREVPDFPAGLAVLVEHMILSHHGKLEFGSPKVPMFPEALLLSYLDDLDSKMECMRAQLERDDRTEGSFSAYNYAMERTFLKKDLFLDGPRIVEEAPPEAVPVESSGRSNPVAVKRPNAPSTRRTESSFPSNSLFGDKLLGALGDES